jgi:hypothetical protein
MLQRIRTLSDMTEVFRDEDRCRTILEGLIWPRGRLCPGCGYNQSIAIAGRDKGGKARPGLYQCQARGCRRQFTATTGTPLHATKLPIRTWLQGLWAILQSDKGVSSVRLAEAIGVGQPTAWRMGHALRVLVAAAEPLDGIVEADEVFVGGKPRKDPSHPEARRGKQGSTTKFPMLAAVERPESRAEGDSAGRVRSAGLAGLSEADVAEALAETVSPEAHLMTDGHKSFTEPGKGFAAHDTVRHGEDEYVRGIVHANSVEGFNDKVRRTVSGVFHHISQPYTELYFGEIGFRWSQRVFVKDANRTTRKGKLVSRAIWQRIPPSMQLVNVFRGAIGRGIRRRTNGSINVLSTTALFGI